MGWPGRQTASTSGTIRRDDLPRPGRARGRIAAWMLILACCACQTRNAGTRQTPLPYYNAPDFTPVWIDDPGTAGVRIPHTIGDFSLTDQEGNRITQQIFQDKIHVADFFFTACPNLCPALTGNMKRVQDAFRNDPEILLVSFSVMPWVDTVPRLKEYAGSHQIVPEKWHLLTGARAEIYDLARRSYFAEEQTAAPRDSADFLHTERFILVDRTKRIRGIYNGTLPLEISRLIEDIALLKREG